MKKKLVVTLIVTIVFTTIMILKTWWESKNFHIELIAPSSAQAIVRKIEKIAEEQ